MKLNDIFKRAVRLCGVGEEFLENNDLKDLHARGLEAINTVLFDLCDTQRQESLSCEVDVSTKATDAAVYGTAMFLSLAYGDTDKSELFSNIYNQKRTAAKSKIGEIADVMPRTEAV